MSAADKSSSKASASSAVALLVPHLQALRAAAAVAHEKVTSACLGGTGGVDVAAALRGEISAAALHIAAMKKASRAAYNAKAAHLEEVSAEKERFEATSLRLQNLQYARDQLQRKIQRCRDFPTTEMDAVELIPLAEFMKDTGYKSGTGTGSNKKQKLRAEGEAGPDDEAHQLTLLRLKHELQLRQSLTTRLKSLREQAKETEIATGLKTRFLADANDRLKALEEATLPLQRFFGLEMTATDKRHRAAITKLAGPLYVIYRQLDAYSQTVAEVAKPDAVGGSGSKGGMSSGGRPYGKVTLTIVPALPFAGSHVITAKDYVELPHPSALATRQGSDDGNSIGNSSDTSTSSMSRKRKRGTDVGNHENGNGNESNSTDTNTKKDAAAEVAVFPHAVLAKFTSIQSAKRVRVRFQMVPALNVVTAEIEGDIKCSSDAKTKKGTSANCETHDPEVFDVERAFLGGLFGDSDTGVEAGDYASERVQLAAQAGLKLSSSNEASTGRAYFWAQWLGGAKRLLGADRARFQPSVPSIVAALLK